ncbi:MAG: hypothetical protein U1E73_05310 [Planctomycetota bacterium]
MLYLDTSAIRQLADDQRHACLRADLVHRVGHGAIFCTSIIALEEVITSTRGNPGARESALELLRELVPHGVMWHWHPIVRQWVSVPAEARPQSCCEVRPWDALDALITEEQIAGMRAEQERLQDGARRFREAVARDLLKSGHLDCSAEKASFWADPDRVVKKAGELSSHLFSVRGNIVALLHSLGRVTDGDASWEEGEIGGCEFALVIS